MANPANAPTPEPAEPRRVRLRRLRAIRAALVAVAVVALGSAAASLMRVERIESARTTCLSNERRLANALLLYAQDHDGRTPPPEFAVNSHWRNWVDLVEPYTSNERIAVCPANQATGAREPRRGYPYPYGYALNERFYGVFSPGPYPIEDLELAAQTVLLAESGPFRGTKPPVDASLAAQSSPEAAGPWSASIYTDTAQWPWAYRSPHDGRMNVAAADGHVTTIKVAHYGRAGHDGTYGRLGGSIYNWNGGHPNGDTGGPPRE